MSDEHGTYAAYQVHTRAGEKPCSACRAAATRYARDRRRRLASQPVVQALLAEGAAIERARIREATDKNHWGSCRWYYAERKCSCGLHDKIDGDA